MSFIGFVQLLRNVKLLLGNFSAKLVQSVCGGGGGGGGGGGFIFCVRTKWTIYIQYINIRTSYLHEPWCEDQR